MVRVRGPFLDTFKIVFIGILLLTCLLMTYGFHIFFRQEFVFTHCFYVPIVLAGIWWGSKGTLVAFLLAANLWISHLFSSFGHPIHDDFLRGAIFIVVGLSLGLVVDESHRHHREALNEKKMRIKEIEDHLEYIEKVAHELRNPLQVAIGVVESLEPETMTSEQNMLISMLDRNTDRLIYKIKELTPDEPPYKKTAYRRG